MLGDFVKLLSQCNKIKVHGMNPIVCLAMELPEVVAALLIIAVGLTLSSEVAWSATDVYVERLKVSLEMLPQGCLFI